MTYEKISIQRKMETIILIVWKLMLIDDVNWVKYAVLFEQKIKIGFLNFYLHKMFSIYE